MSDHTATTEDVAAAICNGNTEHLRKWPLVAESAFCGECYAVATRLAERGLLATTRPDTTEAQAQALEAAADRTYSEGIAAWLRERAAAIREEADQ